MIAHMRYMRPRGTDHKPRLMYWVNVATDLHSVPRGPIPRSRLLERAPEDMRLEAEWPVAVARAVGGGMGARCVPL